jgi:hypothetical protein
MVALCSTELVMICVLSGSIDAAERIAELMDSEPQLVKDQLIRRAIDERADLFPGDI